MALHELKIEIDAGAAAAADDVLLEHGSENWSVWEDVVARRAWICGIGTDENTMRAQWAELAPRAAAAGVVTVSEPAVRPLADVDWRDSYKAHFKAWRFGRLHWVPVWERETFSPPPGDAVLWLDPGLAFGTGNHETTRLCVERLVAIATESGVSSPEFGVDRAGRSEPQTPKSEPGAPRRVVDAGCGSGILALSAALLGYRDVTGFDHDPEAVRISGENAALNGLADRVRFRVADLPAGLAGEQAAVLLANIQGDVLMRFAKELVEAVEPGGVLVLSGILAGENARVRETFESLTGGWSVNARVMGEWSDVVLTRPTDTARSAGTPLQSP